MASQMKFARIDLSKTNYQISTNWRYLHGLNHYPSLHQLYRRYCEYKQFTSVMPLFDNQFHDPLSDIIGYYYNNTLVAFSLIKIYDQENAEALQFAWDYANPELHLGIESLKNECAVYKERGFKYLYLGKADEYKKQIDGFEILGKL